MPRQWKRCGHLGKIDNQYVQPFKFLTTSTTYRLGAAYLIDTGDGLILIDSLYGSWLPVLLNNIHNWVLILLT